MKVKELLKVLLMDEKVTLSYIDEKNQFKDVKSTVGLIQYEEELIEKDVNIMYYSTMDKSYHIITAHQ